VGLAKGKCVAKRFQLFQIDNYTGKRKLLKVYKYWIAALDRAFLDKRLRMEIRDLKTKQVLARTWLNDYDTLRKFKPIDYRV